MPTDYTIGTGGDYTTISAWIADLPADLAGTGRHIGRCLNQGFDEVVTISGNANPSTSDYIELTAADGASFADDDSIRLEYNTNNGAHIDRGSGNWSYNITLNVEHTRMNRLQVRRGGTNQYGITTANNVTISQCIIQARNRPLFQVAKVHNCLVVIKNNNDLIACRSASNTEIQYVTALAPSDATRSRNVIVGTYSTPRVKNVAGFGQSRLYNIANVSGDSTTNASDTTDNLTGSDLTSVTYNQTQPFVDASDASPTTNFKIFSGSALEGAGQPSEITIDIFGNPRPSSSPSIGCHESQSVGPGPEPSENALMFGSNF